MLRYDQIAKKTVGCSGVCGYVFVFNPGHDSRGQSHSLPIISLGIEGPISVPPNTPTPSWAHRTRWLVSLVTVAMTTRVLTREPEMEGLAKVQGGG